MEYTKYCTEIQYIQCLRDNPNSILFEKPAQQNFTGLLVTEYMINIPLLPSPKDLVPQKHGG